MGDISKAVEPVARRICKYLELNGTLIVGFRGDRYRPFVNEVLKRIYFMDKYGLTIDMVPEDRFILRDVKKLLKEKPEISVLLPLPYQILERFSKERYSLKEFKHALRGEEEKRVVKGKKRKHH